MVLPQWLKIERDDPHIFVKTATVYWDYNNVFPKYNDKIAYRGSTVRFEEVSWMLSMIKDKFTYELGTTILKANKYETHSSIGMKPSDVDKKNEWQVWLRLYGSDMSDYPTPKLRVGDTVRVSKYKNMFGRGFEPNFSEEIFEVSKVYQGNPVTYEIQGHTREKILGRLYEEELSVIKKKDGVFRIDKILRRKTVRGKKMAFVERWKGYGPESDSWVMADTIQKV